MPTTILVAWCDSLDHVHVLEDVKYGSVAEQVFPYPLDRMSQSDWP